MTIANKGLTVTGGMTVYDYFYTTVSPTLPYPNPILPYPTPVPYPPLPQLTMI